MAALLRFANRQVLNGMLQNGRCGMLAAVRPVTIRPQPAKTPEDLGHDERNMKLGRPQSPHLTIYAPQLTAMLSISHRATGIMLAGYTILFGLGALVLPDSITTYIDVLQDAKVGFPILAAVKFILVFPLSYHFWNGIRHLMWDMGKYLTLKEVYTTGYLMLAVSYASAAILSVL